MVKVKHLRWYWRREENSNEGLLGNRFFKETMSWNKFSMIRRGFQTNLDEFIAHYHKVSKKYYSPSLLISVDDDLDKCETKSSEVVHIERKA